MLRVPFLARHPALDQLRDLLAPASDAAPVAADRAARAARARTATHVTGCARCRDALAWLRTLECAAQALPAPELPAGLRARVLASRAAGVRTLVPADDQAAAAAPPASRSRGRSTRAAGAAPDAARVPNGRRRAALVAAAVAAVLALVVGPLLSPRTSVQAGTTRGTLTLSPAMPRPGQAVAVRYQPAALLGDQPWLALRARVRRPGDEVPSARLVRETLAPLRRQPDGTFSGTFTLPDSAVYAALAVEDSAATVVDADGGRAWEVLTAAADGRPQFDALAQRFEDLTGRNWEEGFATARRMVALYPDDVRAWSTLRAMQGWLNRGDDDSVRAVDRARLAAFDARLARQAEPSSEAMGRLAWYAFESGADTAIARRWRARLLREAPTDAFAVEWRLVDVVRALASRRDTAAALRQFDALWADAPTRARRWHVAQTAALLAERTADTARTRRWRERLVATDRDSAEAAHDMAAAFARDPRFRQDGMARLREELRWLAAPSPADRGLTETAAQQRARYAGARRLVLAELGRALVTAHAYRAGLDTLALATAAGWDVDVFRAAAAASVAAGDTAGALTMAARVAADPRTPAAYADSVRPLAERVLGRAGWAARRAAARRAFVERVVADAPSAALVGPARLTDSTGQTRDLRDLAAGRVTVVAFWSPNCGPAVQDLPRLAALAARLGREGARVVAVAEGAGPSPEVSGVLARAHVTLPVYFDARHEASRALNQWGTPYYYVLGADGRVRFDVVTSADEALVRAEALRLADAPRR